MAPLYAKHISFLLSAIFALMACASTLAAEEIIETPIFVEDGKLQIEKAIEHFEDLYRSGSSIGEVEMTVTRPRRTQTMRMKIWTEGADKSLVVIQAPPRERGTATLKVDNNLWNHMPRIRRTIRVPSSMMLSSWMGSDFTNDDLVREASFLEDYDYELVGQNEEPAGWLVRFTAKPDMVGLWNQIDLVLNEEGNLPVQARYHDRRDRLARILLWDDIKVLGGRRLPTRMTLIPEDQEGNKTELLYHELEFDVTLPPDIFSLSRLEQQS